ncbi:hypothetical protein ACO22_01133 [Paracoccidioides brasiliensis]|uniref:Uncharacterized protein n=1 Tax=Paracoccidioides brasiliensis TaxID=121759 RepID=A0A1D2JMH0_PARBR|nr:hypothetical protein ACO22_01133 [Paracoccidioides brasiliensis]
MSSEPSIQQSLLDTIERSFYQESPAESREQTADHHQHEKHRGMSSSDTAYHPVSINLDTLGGTDIPPLQPRQRQLPQNFEMPGRPANGLVFLLHWGCVILTVAATVLFGVWAPLSYEATKEANKDNDQTLRALVRSAQSANEMATSALSSASRHLAMATAQASAISNLQSQLAAMGQIAMLQYCDGQTRGDFVACSSFLNSINLTSLVSQIVTPPTAIPTPTSTGNGRSSPTRNPSDTNSRSRDLSLSIGSILGIIFGGTAAVGIVMGFIVWRYQRRRLVDSRRFH